MFTFLSYARQHYYLVFYQCQERKLCFYTAQIEKNSSHGYSLPIPVIRATVPKLDLDDAFEQKNDIAKAVEEELEKVCVKHCFLFN